MSDPFSGFDPSGFDPRMFEQVPFLRELGRLMSWRSGPVNWDTATQTAKGIVTAEGGEDAEHAEDQAVLAEAVTTAEHWLDPVVVLPAVNGPIKTYRPAEWAKLATAKDGLGRYVEPLATGMAAALATGMTQNMPPEMQQMMGGQGAGGMVNQALGSMSAFFYGLQIGTVAGHLSLQLHSCNDLGVPILATDIVGTVGTTAGRFAKDYGFDEAEFRHWLALRECAHRRVFAGVDWLADHLAGLISEFAAAADFDPTAMMEQFGGIAGPAMGGLDPNDPDSMRELLSGDDAFRVEPTAGQQASLERIQALVSFVEAYNATVVRAAGQQRLSALGRIEEAVLRRRAERGPGEVFLQQLIGLDLRPADFRTGRAFCDAVVTARGIDGLDRVWQDAAYLPTTAEQAEPSRWLVRMAAAELPSSEPDEG